MNNTYEVTPLLSIKITELIKNYYKPEKELKLCVYSYKLLLTKISMFCFQQRRRSKLSYYSNIDFTHCVR